MGNKYKGTFEIEIDGKEYTLRPSFDALCEFQELTGISPNLAREELLREDGGYNIKIIPAAIYAGMKGEHLINGQKIPTFRLLGEMLRKHGMFKFHYAATKLLTYAISSDDIIDRVESSKIDIDEDQKKS